MIAKLIKTFLTVAFILPLSARAEMVPPPFPPTQREFPVLEGHYIYPNEWFDAAYKESVEGLTGVAVTTGTFRALQRVLYGNFDWMFVVDIDPKVTEFNRLNYEAIMQAGSRREYLENFPSFYQDEFGTLPPKGKNLPLLNFMNASGQDGALISARDLPEEKRRLNQFYFNNDRLFLALKRKLKSTKTVFLKDDLTSLELAEKLAAFLKQEGLHVTLLDISNIMDYVIAEGGVINARTKRAAARMADFIETLRLRTSDTVLFTTMLDNDVYRKLLNGDDFEPMEDTFKYYVGSAQNVVDMLRLEKKFSTKRPKLILGNKISCEDRTSGKRPGKRR